MAAGSKVVKIFAGGFAVGAVASLTLFDNVGYFATVDGKSMQVRAGVYLIILVNQSAGRVIHKSNQPWCKLTSLAIEWQ